MGIITKILGTLLLSFLLLLPLHLSIIFAEKPDSANSPSAKPVNISEYAANIPSDEQIISSSPEPNKIPEEQEPLSEITEDVLPDESEVNLNQNEEVNYPSDDRIVSPPPEVKKLPEKQEPPSKVVEDTASNESEDEGVIQNYSPSNVSANNPDIYEAVRIFPEKDKPLPGKGKSKGGERDQNKTGGKDAPTQNKEPKDDVTKDTNKNKPNEQSREDKERTQSKASSKEASVQNKESKGDANKDTNGNRAGRASGMAKEINR